MEVSILSNYWESPKYRSNQLNFWTVQSSSDHPLLRLMSERSMNSCLTLLDTSVDAEDFMSPSHKNCCIKPSPCIRTHFYFNARPHDIPVFMFYIQNSNTLANERKTHHKSIFETICSEIFYALLERYQSQLTQLI